MRMVKFKTELFKLRITQAELARRLGLSPSRVSRIVNGRFRPRGVERRRIAAFLKMRESRLFPHIRRRHDSEEARG